MKVLNENLSEGNEKLPIPNDQTSLNILENNSNG